MEEGTLLGFVISPDGITIDPGRIEAIKAIVLPHKKKAMQSFLGKINFMRRFISNFAEIVKPLQEMIKKIITSSGQRRGKKHLRKSKKPL